MAKIKVQWDGGLIESYEAAQNAHINVNDLVIFNDERLLIQADNGTIQGKVWGRSLDMHWAYQYCIYILEEYS